jgi:hypothetical protein
MPGELPTRGEIGDKSSLANWTCPHIYRPFVFRYQLPCYEFLFSDCGRWACQAWTTKRCVRKQAWPRSWSCWDLSPARRRATRFEVPAPSTHRSLQAAVRSQRILAKTRTDVSVAGPPGINLISGKRRPNSRSTKLPSTSANASTGRYLDSRVDPMDRPRSHGRRIREEEPVFV